MSCESRSVGLPTSTTQQVRAGQSQDTRYPQSPQNIGDALGAKVAGGRGPSLNGAPATNFTPPASPAPSDMDGD
jgi:hypothetical protein